MHVIVRVIFYNKNYRFVWLWYVHTWRLRLCLRQCHRQSLTLCQCKTSRMGSDPFCVCAFAFLLMQCLTGGDVDANANAKCEHTFRKRWAPKSSVLQKCYQREVASVKIFSLVVCK